MSRCLMVIASSFSIQLGLQWSAVALMACPYASSAKSEVIWHADSQIHSDTWNMDPVKRDTMVSAPWSHTL